MVGFNSSATPFRLVKKEYNAGIRIMVGSASKNTIYSDLGLRSELDLPSFDYLTTMARARAVWKYATLKTVIASLMTQRHVSMKKSWVTQSRDWLKKVPKINPDILTWEEARPLLEAYLQGQELKSESAKTVSFKRWRDMDFNSTKNFWLHASFDVNLATGVNWLIRARCSGIWTAARATKFGLVTRDILGKCPKCMLNIDAPELEHIVFDCTGYSLQREKYLESILEAIPAMDSPTQTLQVLLGGKGQTVGGESYSMGHSWSGEDAQTLRGTGRPGFVPVSMFLGTVCPTQMGVLWKWKPNLDGDVR